MQSAGPGRRPYPPPAACSRWPISRARSPCCDHVLKRVRLFKVAADVQVSRRLGAAAGRRYIGSMCGRARLSSDVSEIKIAFGIPPERPAPNFPPSWNVAPTDSLPIVHFNPKEGQRSLDMMRWGLIPYWAKDIKVGFANINAKAEGIEKKPAFGKAFERRRRYGPAAPAAIPRPGMRRS
jgi:hypothetical protein